MDPEQRAHQAFKDFITHANIPKDDLRPYQEQAREIREQHGVDYCATWLEAWAAEVREDAARWARRRADGQARVISTLCAPRDTSGAP